MSISEFQVQYLKDQHQFIILNDKGSVLLSCNSLVNLEKNYGQNINDLFPMYDSLAIETDHLSNAEKVSFYGFSFQFETGYGTYDISLMRIQHEDETCLLLTLEDRTEQYQYWLNIQQEGNVSLINKEIIDKQAKIINEKSREVSRSIAYAKRIQHWDFGRCRVCL